MNDVTINEAKRAHVIVNFRTSSTKGGAEAYETTVDSDATEDEVRRTVALATLARDLAKAHLERDQAVQLVEQLTESLKGAPPKKELNDLIDEAEKALTR